VERKKLTLGRDAWRSDTGRGASSLCFEVWILAIHRGFEISLGGGISGWVSALPSALGYLSLYTLETLAKYYPKKY